jgi:hypothetical protein
MYKKTILYIFFIGIIFIDSFFKEEKQSKLSKTPGGYTRYRYDIMFRAKKIKVRS